MLAEARNNLLNLPQTQNQGIFLCELSSMKLYCPLTIFLPQPIKTKFLVLVELGPAQPQLFQHISLLLLTPQSDNFLVTY